MFLTLPHGATRERYDTDDDNDDAATKKMMVMIPIHQICTFFQLSALLATFPPIIPPSSMLVTFFQLFALLGTFFQL